MSDAPAPVKELTMEDVWGTFDLKKMERTSNGMVVAQGYGEPDNKGYFTPEQYAKCIATISDVCPIWGDKLPYKSVTVICQNNQLVDVLRWLELVHGSGCVSKMAKLKFDRTAIRSNYKCW